MIHTYQDPSIYNVLLFQTMVLYDERGAYFAQALSDVNATGWPQEQVRIEEGKPKHTLDYHPGNNVFRSPPLAFEANVRSQKQNLPSQAHQSSVNDVSRTYFTGSPEQEPIRYGDYFPISESQGHSSFTNESQHYPEATQQPITSIRNDLASQDRKVLKYNKMIMSGCSCFSIFLL